MMLVALHLSEVQYSSFMEQDDVKFEEWSLVIILRKKSGVLVKGESWNINIEIMTFFLFNIHAIASI